MKLQNDDKLALYALFKQGTVGIWYVCMCMRVGLLVCCGVLCYLLLLCVVSGVCWRARAPRIFTCQQTSALTHRNMILPSSETPKPGLFEMVAKAKWNAWKALGSMDKDEAMVCTRSFCTRRIG